MGCPGVPIPQSKILKAIKENHGRIVKAAKSLGCSPSAIYERAKVEPEIQEAVDKARKDYDAELIECACDALLENVKDKKESSVFFALKTKGKDLGFEQNDTIVQQVIPFEYKGKMDQKDVKDAEE